MSGRSKHMRTKDPHSKYEKQYEQSVTSALTKKTIVDKLFFSIIQLLI